jgi:hypothetical protein
MKFIGKKSITGFVSCIVAVTLFLGVLPASATSNRVQLAKSWDALIGDYNQIISGLQSGNETKAEAGFIKFSRDCIPLATFETSFSYTINQDIFAVAQLGNAWAWVGYITLTTNSGVSAFQTQTNRLKVAMEKFARDLKKGL